MGMFAVFICCVIILYFAWCELIPGWWLVRYEGKPEKKLGPDPSYKPSYNFRLMQLSSLRREIEELGYSIGDAFIAGNIELSDQLQQRQEEAWEEFKNLRAELFPQSGLEERELVSKLRFGDITVAQFVQKVGVKRASILLEKYNRRGYFNRCSYENRLLIERLSNGRGQLSLSTNTQK